MALIKTSLIAKLAIFLFFFASSVKIFDLTLGLIGDLHQEAAPTKKRSLLLKEWPPNLNTIVTPSNDYMVGTQNLKQKDFLFRTDEDGFIVGPKKNADKEKKVSVIFFGGSTTECMYVEEDRRFPYLVSQILNVRVLNGGVSGNHSVHSLLSLIGKGVPYQPNHVIIMHAVNDLGILSKTLSYWNAPPDRSLIQVNKAYPITYQLAVLIKNAMIPNLWSRTRHIFYPLVDKMVSDEWTAYRSNKFDSFDIEKISIEQFTAALKAFVAVSRAWKIEPILMTQFNRIRKNDIFTKASYEKHPQPISYDDFVRLYEKMNDVVRAVAKLENVFLIDLDAEVPPTREYLYDSVHLTTQGSDLVAEKIAIALKTRYPHIYR